MLYQVTNMIYNLLKYLYGQKNTIIFNYTWKVYLEVCHQYNSLEIPTRYSLIGVSYLCLNDYHEGYLLILNELSPAIKTYSVYILYFVYGKFQTLDGIYDFPNWYGRRYMNWIFDIDTKQSVSGSSNKQTVRSNHIKFIVRTTCNLYAIYNKHQLLLIFSINFPNNIFNFLIEFLRLASLKFEMSCLKVNMQKSGP